MSKKKMVREELVKVITEAARRGETHLDLSADLSTDHFDGPYLTIPGFHSLVTNLELSVNPKSQGNRQNKQGRNHEPKKKSKQFY